jgi:hypothetical protein
VPLVWTIGSPWSLLGPVRIVGKAANFDRPHLWTPRQRKLPEYGVHFEDLASQAAFVGTSSSDLFSAKRPTVVKLARLRVGMRRSAPVSLLEVLLTASDIQALAPHLAADWPDLTMFADSYAQKRIDGIEPGAMPPNPKAISDGKLDDYPSFSGSDPILIDGTRTFTLELSPSLWLVPIDAIK